MARGVSSGQSIEVHAVARLVDDTEVDCIVQATSPFPQLGPQQVMCDFQRLRQIMGGPPPIGDQHYWIFSRPDYRVIEEMAA
jgi:hypothetical protein